MKKKPALYLAYVCVGLFVLFIMFGLIHYISIEVWNKVKTTEQFNSRIFYHDDWINLYGLSQRAFGKRQIEHFTIFRTPYNKLVSPRNKLSEEEIKKKFDELYVVIEHLNSLNIPYYYLTSILPIQETIDLPKGVNDESRDNQEKLNSLLDQANINTINLSQANSVQAIPRESLFYRTDHHWRLETCFAAYCQLIQRIEEDCRIDLNSRITTDIQQYEHYKIPESFLGSYGVKVGKNYIGKDDFIIYIPIFPTSMVFQSFDQDGKLILEKSGDFFSALLDEKMLSMDYDNKYNAFCNFGYIENRILNPEAPTDLKCLYISHSYGRPLSMYLSLNFREVINLDPQIGRFSGNYLTYIKECKPDIVIIQSEFEGEIIGEYKTVD